MTDNEYGNAYQAPSSRPPEPPYRPAASYEQVPATPAEPYYAAQQPTNPAFGTQQPTNRVPETQGVPVQPQNSPMVSQPDVRGVDAPVDVPATSAYVPAAASDPTESFAAARSGNTGRMPRVEAPYGGASQGVQGAQSAQSAQGAQSAQSAQSAQGGYIPYAAQRPRSDAGYASAQVPPASQAGSGAHAKKSPSAAKMFLFGFLGALVACALAIGGFAIVNGGLIRTQATSALIGTTDQTVINAVDEGQTLAEAVAAKALPSVVAIYNYQDMSNMYGYGYGSGYGTQGGDSMVAAGMGSGVVISNDGYILTNYHVVEDAAKLTINVDGKERDAKYIGGDKSSDVAVIKVEDTEGLVAADIGDSDNLRIGEWVMTVGAPLGLEQSVCTGVVSATNRDTVMDSASNSSDPYSQMFGYTNSQPEYVYYPNMIQTDAVINPGNSGGALVDADGKLIGINSMFSSQSGNYAGVGFAIPINYAIGIAQDVINGKEPTHAILGVSLSQVNSTIAQRYNLSADKGAYISAITPGTGAADSELQVGDIITAIDGKAVSSTTDVTLDVRAHKVGDTVTVTVNRDGETKDIQVKLTSDENLTKTTEDNQKQKQDEKQNDGQGNGRGQGNGYTQEDIERLMEMLGF